ncbi:MAG: diaminopimelate decarboxylase [Ignavibacteria bacterium]|nr:diaminopimelate decarboxylase [Ignavibacteria bacterium]
MNKINGFDILEIAEKFGTPIYVYDAKKIKENYSKLYSSFSNYFEKFTIHYSLKANSNIHILKILKNLGAGADCSSPIELNLALNSGFDPTKIIYTGNFESSEDLREITRYNIKINLDDITSYFRLKEICSPNFVSFRVNPGIGKGGFEGITTGGTDAKFGVPYELIPQAYKTAKSDGVNNFGVHIMTGSNILEPFYFAEVLDKLFKIVGNVFKELDIQPRYIDIGGGFGIPYTETDKELEIDFTAKLIADVFFENTRKFELGIPELKIEPGRYLIGNAGYLITKITGIKNGYKKFIGVDAGMNIFPRPALYGAQHKVTLYKKEVPNQIVQVCGQICENSDILAKNVAIPEPKEGDILVFHNAGAYCYSMASNYNGRLLPAEVLLDQKPLLIRKRQTFEDILETMRFE